MKLYIRNLLRETFMVNINKEPFIEFIAQHNNEEYQEVEMKFKDVEFITLYRAEGKVVDRDKLPTASSHSAGKWFTPNFKEAQRYKDMDPNRTIYKIDVPKAFYDAIRSSSKRLDISKGEVQLPLDLVNKKQKL